MTHPQAGEPVAWMVDFPHRAGGSRTERAFYWIDGVMLQGHRDSGHTVTPLYASPPLPPDWLERAMELHEAASSMAVVEELNQSASARLRKMTARAALREHLSLAAKGRGEVLPLLRGES